jgi:hypothetical protein
VASPAIRLLRRRADRSYPLLSEGVDMLHHPRTRLLELPEFVVIDATLWTSPKLWMCRYNRWSHQHA